MVLDKKYGAPLITNDGVTIAKEIELEEPFENMGAQLVKEVSSKTNDDAGDGTTTATLLAQALVREGMKNVAAGANPMVVKNGIKAAVDAAVAGIQKESKAVSGSDAGAAQSGQDDAGGQGLADAKLDEAGAVDHGQHDADQAAHGHGGQGLGVAPAGEALNDVDLVIL